MKLVARLPPFGPAFRSSVLYLTSRIGLRTQTAGTICNCCSSHTVWKFCFHNILACFLTKGRLSWSATSEFSCLCFQFLILLVSTMKTKLDVWLGGPSLGLILTYCNVKCFYVMAWFTAPVVVTYDLPLNFTLELQVILIKCIFICGPSGSPTME